MRLTIAKGALSQDGFGQVVAEDIQEKLVCPQCGTQASDDGECLLRFDMVPNPNPTPELVDRAPLVLAIIADCRTCGYYGPGPTDVFIPPE